MASLVTAYLDGPKKTHIFTHIFFFFFVCQKCKKKEEISFQQIFQDGFQILAPGELMVGVITPGSLKTSSNIRCFNQMFLISKNIFSFIRVIFPGLLKVTGASTKYFQVLKQF